MVYNTYKYGDLGNGLLLFTHIIWNYLGIIRSCWRLASPWRVFFLHASDIFFVPSWNHWMVEFCRYNSHVCLSNSVFVGENSWSLQLKSSKFILQKSTATCYQHVINSKISDSPDAPRAVFSIPGAACRVAHFGQRPGLRLAEFPAVHGVPGTRRPPRCHHGAQVQGPKVFVEVVMGLLNVPFWVYWTSPEKVAIIDHIPNGI